MSIEADITKHTGRVIDAVRGAIAGKPFEDATPTGFPGSVFVAHIPQGWAQVTYFPQAHSDRNDDYVGPVLSDTDTAITIEVFGEPLTFIKAHCIVDYPLARA